MSSSKMSTPKILKSHVLCALLLAGTAAKASSLYAAAPYNVFVFGSFTETGSDTGGRLAVGGNASFSGYYAIEQGPLDSAVAPGGNSLVVGGKILQGTANVLAGNAYVGTETPGSVQLSGGATESTGSPSPIDFSAAATDLTSYSAYLGSLAATGTVNNNGYGTITLTGNDPTLNMFTIDGSLIGGNNTVNINVTPGSTVVINVLGASVTTTGAGININGSGVNGNSTTTQAAKVLFNFYQATSVTFGGGFLGTVLAPSAAVTGNYNQLDGQLIAASFSGSTEFHDFVFDGITPTNTNVSPVPEPTTVAMLGAGLFALGAFRRRR